MHDRFVLRVSGVCAVYRPVSVEFYRPGDVILPPYDKHIQGWSFYNEIRGGYDFHRYTLSLVPRGRTNDAEEWAGYARLLLREAAKQLHHLGNQSMLDLFKYTSLVSAEDLKNHS